MVIAKDVVQHTVKMKDVHHCKIFIRPEYEKRQVVHRSVERQAGSLCQKKFSSVKRVSYLAASVIQLQREFQVIVSCIKSGL